MAIIRKTLSNGKVIRKGLMTKGNTYLSGGKGALVAGLNEGVTTLGDYAFNTETQHMARRSIRKAKNERAAQYLDQTMEFQLHRGGHAFGKPKSMTGREARELNRRYEETFYCSKDPETRLWRWFRVGTVVNDKPITLNEYRRRRFEASTK